MFDEILVAIDIGEVGQIERSLDVARKNLSPTGRMTLFHVVDSHSSNMTTRIDPADRTNLLNAARSKLQEIVAAKGLADRIEVKVDNGNVYKKIIEHAGDGNHQAIVIASHTPGLGSKVMGSVAAQVVKHASCSVLVVRSAHY